MEAILLIIVEIAGIFGLFFILEKTGYELRISIERKFMDYEDNEIDLDLPVRIRPYLDDEDEWYKEN